MKIKINKDVKIRAKINMKTFENIFKKTFDLEEAIMNTIEITEDNTKENLSQEELKKFILYGTDWGNILMLYPLSNKTDIHFHVLECEITDGIIYNPDKLEYENTTFVFNNKEVNKTDFFILNDLNRKIDAQLEFMIGSNLIDYVNFDWKKIFNFLGGSGK